MTESGADADAVRAVHREWIAREVAGRPWTVLDLCVEDVTWWVPGSGMLRGRDAVGGWLRSQPEVRISDIEITGLDIQLSGDLAVKRAVFVTRLGTGPDGGTTVVRGSHLWVLRRVPRQGWRVQDVAWVLEA